MILLGRAIHERMEQLRLELEHDPEEKAKLYSAFNKVDPSRKGSIHVGQLAALSDALRVGDGITEEVMDALEAPSGVIHLDEFRSWYAEHRLAAKAGEAGADTGEDAAHALAKQEALAKKAALETAAARARERRIAANPHASLHPHHLPEGRMEPVVTPLAARPHTEPNMGVPSGTGTSSQRAATAAEAPSGTASESTLPPPPPAAEDAPVALESPLPAAEGAPQSDRRTRTQDEGRVEVLPGGSSVRATNGLFASDVSTEGASGAHRSAGLGGAPGAPPPVADIDPHLAYPMPPGLSERLSSRLGLLPGDVRFGGVMGQDHEEGASLAA